MDISMKSFVMESGERYCLLVDRDSGLPLYYPNLFVTTQVRNRSLSFSAMESALGGIAALLRFIVDMHVNLTHRGCGQKLGLLGGSSCTHTKTAFEQSNFISS